MTEQRARPEPTGFVCWTLPPAHSTNSYSRPSHSGVAQCCPPGGAGPGDERDRPKSAGRIVATGRHRLPKRSRLLFRASKRSPGASLERAARSFPKWNTRPTTALPGSNWVRPPIPIIHKIDRSARNLKDWSDLGEMIDSGIQVHFVNESLDLHSRGGRLSADIQAVVAADYIRNLREETRKGFYGRIKQGVYPLPAPLGYPTRSPSLGRLPLPPDLKACTWNSKRLEEPSSAARKHRLISCRQELRG